MSLWRPFPPGAQALVPPGFLTVRCPHCGRGTVDAVGGLDAWKLWEDELAVHREQSCTGRIRDWQASDRDLVLNVARSLDSAARDAAPPRIGRHTARGVARIRGIRQARSLRWPWFAWLWELLPE